MSCRKVCQNLSAYLDRVLPVVMQEQISVHLKDCPECRNALNQLQELKLLMMSLPIPAMPEDISRQVLARARERLTQRQSNHKLTRPLFRWWCMETWATRLATVAVLVLGLVAGSLLGRSTSRRFIGSYFSASIKQQSDPLALYELEYFSSNPSGSIEEVYLAMVLCSQEGEE